VAQQGAPAAHPLSTPAPPPAAAPAAPLQPCPFTFGDWLPRTDPQAHPGEAQRAVFRDDVLVGWWRRQVITPLPLDGDPPQQLGAPFHAHAIASPDGAALLAASLDSQAMLEVFATAVA